MVMVLPSIRGAFSVDVRRRLSPHELERDYVARRRPVVLEGALRESPALGWTLASIAAVAPERKVPITHFPTRNPYAREDAVIALGALGAWHEALALPRADSDDAEPYPYLICDLATHLPELLPDAARAPRPDLDRAVAFELFAGRDTISGSHFHAGTHALLAQLSGEKRVILHPPEESARLYPHPAWNFHYGHSRSRYDQLDRFPELAKARAAEVTLRPGDVLLVPARWWHTVFGVGASISTSYFWRARGLRQAVARVTPRLLDLVWRATHPKVR